MTVPGPAGPTSPHPTPAGPGVPDGPVGQQVGEPPAGPGVAPPFAAPPIEGRSARMWVGLGVGALAVLLCCGSGAAALVGLAVAGGKAIDEQSRTVVGNYFDAISDRDYSRAYSLLCDAEQRDESLGEFERRISAEPDIATYRVGEARGNDQIEVPVNVRYTGGDQDVLRVTLTSDHDTGELEVCGVD